MQNVTHESPARVVMGIPDLCRCSRVPRPYFSCVTEEEQDHIFGVFNTSKASYSTVTFFFPLQANFNGECRVQRQIKWTTWRNNCQARRLYQDSEEVNFI